MNHEQNKSKAWKWHKDWRLWVAVALMLLAMLVYLLTLDESINPLASPVNGK